MKFIPLLTGLLLTSFSSLAQYVDYFKIEVEKFEETEHNLDQLKNTTTSFSYSWNGDVRFPNQIFNYTSLKALSISHTYSWNNRTKLTLPAKINNLKNLEYLYLSDVNLGTFPSNFSLPKLKLFSYTELDLDIQTLPDFTQFPDISVLTIKSKKDFKLGEVSNFETIFSLKKLKHIELTNNGLTDASLKEMSTIKNLERLNLFSNELTIIQPFLSHTKLIALDIGFNKISSLKGISKLKDLHYLHVSGNKIKEGMEEISSLTNLRNLYLGNCELSRLEKGIGNLKNLKYFSARSNNLEELPSELFEIETLIDVDLVGNPIKSLPDNIVNSKIERIDLTVVEIGKNNYDLEKLAKIKTLKVLHINGLGKSRKKFKKKFKKLRPDVRV